MKYTLLNAETEEKIFEFENAADDTTYSGNMYSAKNSQGKREVLFASRSAKSGQVPDFSAALGTIKRTSFLREALWPKTLPERIRVRSL